MQSDTMPTMMQPRTAKNESLTLLYTSLSRTKAFRLCYCIICSSTWPKNSKVNGIGFQAIGPLRFGFSFDSSDEIQVYRSADQTIAALNKVASF